MSYDGRLGFGLLGDFDALPDLEAIADDLERRDRRPRRAAAPAPTARAPGRTRPAAGARGGPASA